MTNTILITGASSGIGLACVEQALKQSVNVIATARSRNQLESLKQRHPQLKIISADIATQQGRTTIIQQLEQPIDYLLHNAALLMPPQTIEGITLKDFRQNIATNVEPIIFLTQQLLANQCLNTSNHGCRILNMSTGAAQKAIKGMTHYCVSKAAALMASQILKAELTQHNIIINDYFPGVVDTPMQATLRSASDEIFPYASTFNQYKINNQLAKPADIARHIISIFQDSDNSTFEDQPWEFNT